MVCLVLESKTYCLSNLLMLLDKLEYFKHCVDFLQIMNQLILFLESYAKDNGYSINFNQEVILLENKSEKIVIKLT